MLALKGPEVAMMDSDDGLGLSHRVACWRYGTREAIEMLAVDASLEGP